MDNRNDAFSRVSLSVNPQMPPSRKPEKASGPDDRSRTADPQSAVLAHLTPSQQVEVLRFAQKHGINPSDPTWILVDMLGHVRFQTETLPARIEAAGQNTVKAIRQQREAEQRAFSASAIDLIETALSQATDKVARDAAAINETKMRTQFQAYGLAAIGWMALAMTLSSLTGYLLAGGRVFWSLAGDSPVWMVLNLPVGFILIPTYFLSILVIIRFYWRRS